MKKRVVMTAIILILVFGGLFGYKAYQNYQSAQKQATFVPPPISVSTEAAKTEQWQSYLDSVGALQAVQQIDVTPQVTGVVTKINFTSGQVVKKGDPILELDTSVLKAQLDNALAVQTLKRIAYQRFSTLYKTKAASDVQVDTARTEWQQATASVNELKAQIAQKIILAPFAGKLGLRLVSLGQYLQPGTVITNLQTIDPIQVNFSIPSQNIWLLKVGQTVQVTTDAAPGKTFSGQIIAIDGRIDQTTLSIGVRGQVKNPDTLLYPGMYVLVQVVLFAAPKATVTVSQMAITYTLYGDTVFVVGETKDAQGKSALTAQSRYVTVGQRRGTRIAVLIGLKAGEQVVTSGQVKLQNGSRVTINNTAKL